jgi:heme/copper-type cytochrome/quinol oxidase subunit 4
MKHITRVKMIGLIIAAFFTAVPLWAAAAAREDNSDLFVWIFLAFCALVVVAQLIPAILMLLGFAKGVKKKSVQPAPGPADQI